MATLQAVTASNAPVLAPDSVAAVEAIIDDYDFVGTMADLTVTTELSRDDEPYLAIYGFAAFEATHPVHDAEGTVVDREYGHTEEFLERLAPHLAAPLVVETVGFEKYRFPLLASQWAVWPDGTIHYDQLEHDPDKPAPAGTYTVIDPQCPACGATEFATTAESIPPSFDTHYVVPTCEDCGTSFTIEYRPIDISWYDGGDGHHSGVSQGLVDPRDNAYVRPTQFAPLPAADVLESLSWPLACPACEERLTGNDVIRLADTPHDVSASPTVVAFQCPGCDTQPVATPADTEPPEIPAVVPAPIPDTLDDQATTPDE